MKRKVVCVVKCRLLGVTAHGTYSYHYTSSAQNSAPNLTTHKNTLRRGVRTAAKTRRVLQTLGESNTSKVKK
jgi:predicted secreted Zn-dependent protease